MKATRIRWAEHTWNPMTGCTKVSPGCDNCYAETITVKFGATAFPNGFVPTFKPNKLSDPRKWAPSRIFVNSMSDVFHPDFTTDQVDQVFDAMTEIDKHDYLVLTKRPQLMKNYLTGTNGWLSRRNLTEVPAQIWLGTSIENDRYTFRADHLRDIPVAVRFLSCEPLLGPLPSLNLTNIQWVIVGGESGKGYRPMDHDWARDLRDRCNLANIAYYFKQSAAPRTELGIELDGQLHEEYPFPHPGDRLPRTIGRYTGRHQTMPMTLV
jgi:protein gp37